MRGISLIKTAKSDESDVGEKHIKRVEEHFVSARPKF